MNKRLFRENIRISGGMAEWFKAAVLKIASRATGTGVRIPLPPPIPHNILILSGKVIEWLQTLTRTRRGAGVVDQGRLLSDCLGICRDRGFESHPLRHCNFFIHCKCSLRDSLILYGSMVVLSFSPFSARMINKLLAKSMSLTLRRIHSIRRRPLP